MPVSQLMLVIILYFLCFCKLKLNTVVFLYVTPLLLHVLISQYRITYELLHNKVANDLVSKFS